jgi:DNA-binding CsgD family transcriptional regulator
MRRLQPLFSAWWACRAKWRDLRFFQPDIRGPEIRTKDTLMPAGPILIEGRVLHLLESAQLVAHQEMAWRITRQHGRSLQLHIRIAPFPREHSPGGSRFAAIALIGDPERAQRLPFETMRSVYGLTPAEAKLALLLLEGKSISEAAHENEVTKDTVRSQVKSIFLKTGTRRQGELIGLLSSIPGDVR